jgi:hypothetical protein
MTSNRHQRRRAEVIEGRKSVTEFNVSRGDAMTDLRGDIPESWACIDCNTNTAPGCSTREQLEQAFAITPHDQGIAQTIDEHSEIYMVKAKIWKAAGMEEFNGCLCIGCLETRLGRTLLRKDFTRNHPFRMLPGTKRLLQRRGDIRRIRKSGLS